MIYLDDAATTAVEPEVIHAMMPYFSTKWYNPSSLYTPSSSVKADIEFARSDIGKFIGAEPNEIYFTSCGSESNCWAVEGWLNHWRNLNKRTAVITTPIEHKSIKDCVNLYGDFYDKFYIDVDNFGVINVSDLDAISAFCSQEYDKVLVSIQYANNEIGTIQDMKEISEIVHQHGAVLHTDATQAFGKVKIDVKGEGIDLLTASGHKIGTPKGIGILYKKNNIELDPIIYGSQNGGLRGGTENVPYIIGLQKAVNMREDYFKNGYQKQLLLRNMMIHNLIQKTGCKLNGHSTKRLPNNINLTFPQNISGEALLYALDLNDICISTGSACNSKSIKPSYVLKAIGLSDEEAARTIRITLPENITEEEVRASEKIIVESIKLFESLQEKPV